MTKFALLEVALSRFVDKLGTKTTFLVGLFLISICYAISNLMTFIGKDDFATNALFMTLAIACICLGLYGRKLHWFGDLFFCFSIYNFVDELSGTACQINWIEYVSAIATTIYFYYKFNTDVNRIVD